MVHGNVKTFYIPDLLQDWPWPRSINPHYEEVKEESNAWFRSFKAFSRKSQYAFEKCEFPLLAALAYPDVSKKHLRTGCDLMNVFFLIDEYTDVEPGHVVREIRDVIVDAMHKPDEPRPSGEIILGEVARQFWALAVESASPTSQRHMIESLTAYLEAVTQQAINRDLGTSLSITSYLSTRRENVGTRPSFVPQELGLSIPDEVLYHPVIRELFEYVTDMAIVDNDMISYNKEQAVGDDHHNILTVAMRELGTDLDGAINWASGYFNECKRKFLEGLIRVPSWSPDMDIQVKQYLHGVANWIRAQSCWGFECGRYFGSKGLEYQKTRLIPLLPKVASPYRELDLHGENVVVPLIEELEAKGDYCT